MSTVSQAIIVHSNKKRIRDLMVSLAGDQCDVTTIKSVGLSMSKYRPSEGELNLAVRSATKPLKSEFGQAIKKTFLKAQYSWSRNYLSRQRSSVVMCWNGMKGFRFMFMSAAKQCGHRTIYFEEAPLPERVSVDQNGINFGNSLPRVGQFFIEWAEANPDKQGAWRKVRDKITQRKACDSKFEERITADTSGSGRFVFCPLQVPGDSQLTVYGGRFDTVKKTIAFLSKVSAALPEGIHIRVKEHPSSSVRYTELLKGLETEKFVLDNSSDTFDLVRRSVGVLTVNSSVGLESLFFDRPVATLGQAFYAIDGVVTTISTQRDFEQWISHILSMTQNSKLKNALLDYLVEVHFPLESDILSGAYGLEDLIDRDVRAEKILREISI